MIVLLSQDSYRAVPIQPFHGEILCDSNALEGIRTSDHSEMGKDELLSKLTRPCHIITLNDGSPFKGVFTVMCKALNINYDVLSKRNHKDLRLEKCHRFINKAVTIAVEYRGTNRTFVAVGVAAGYA